MCEFAYDADIRSRLYWDDDAPVTFHHFASLFRDEFGAYNALFLDGSISRIYAQDLSWVERGSDLGPIIVLLQDDPPE